MTNKLMYIFIDDSQNYPFYRLQLVVKGLNTERNAPTIKDSRKVPNVVKTKKTDF